MKKCIISVIFFLISFLIISLTFNLVNTSKVNQDHLSSNFNDLITKRELKNDKKNKLVRKLYDDEVNIANKGKNIKLSSSTVELSNNALLKKLLITDGFKLGIHNISPGSGFIHYVNNKLFVVSSNGVMGYVNLKGGDNNLFINQIKTNIFKFLHKDSQLKHIGISIKDLLIHKKKIYISYVNNKDNCINNAIISANLDYNFLEFNKFFTSATCVDPSDADHYGSGGVLNSFNENNILFTVGEHKVRDLAQDLNVINGKVLKINVDSSEYKILSMGHRNPQGLYFDNINNVILETEHGPQGGDEINFIEITKELSGEIPNYGWPISSYGTFYGGEKNPRFEKLKEKYPLHKSHINYGFIEPIIYFDPSIGIGRIQKLSANKFAVATMVEKSLYIFEFDYNNRKAKRLKKIFVGERIRDMDIHDNKLFLFLEDSASIGILKINTLLEYNLEYGKQI